MINIKDLEAAIAETEMLPENYQKCQKLAVFYYLLDRQSKKSIDISKVRKTSEFSTLVETVETNHLFDTIDELLEVLKVMHPNLYNSFISKLKKQG